MTSFNEVGATGVAFSILGAALLFVGAAYWRLLNRKEIKTAADAVMAASIEARFNELQGEMNMLGMTVRPITDAMSAVLVKSLTHFHTPETDPLLAKVGPPNTLTLEEEKKLTDMMRKRAADQSGEFTDLERNGAEMLLLIIERSRLERENPPPQTVMLVGIPKTQE